MRARTVFRAIGAGLRRCVVSAVIAGLARAGATQAQTLDSDFWTPNGTVRAAVREGSSLWITGDFTRIGPWTGNLAVLDSVGGAPVPGVPEVDGEVRAFLPDDAGGWYIGGTFTRVGGVARAHLARLNADRTLSPWNPGANGAVDALARSGGAIVVGGLFTQLGGAARTNVGAVDAATGAATDWAATAGPSEEVLSLAVHGGSVYLGGWFTQVGGLPRNHLAALDRTSGAVRAWNPNADFATYAIAGSGGTVYIGGAFKHVGGDPRESVAEVDTATAVATDWNPTVFGIVYAMIVNPTSVFLAGGFQFVGPATRHDVTEVDRVTGLPTAWTADATGGITAAYVHALSRVGSVLYLAGTFTHVNGVARGGVAAVDAGTGQLLGWNPAAAESPVKALGAAAGRVWIGGVIPSAEGVDRVHLAEIDLVTRRPTAWQPTGPELASAIAKVGSRVFVGGAFGNVGGVPRAGMAAFDARTGALLPWDAHPARGFGSPSVSRIVRLDSLLLVSGVFTSIGGAGANGFAAVGSTTGLASAWNPAPDGPVHDAWRQGSSLFLAGNFQTIGGRTRYGLAAVDATTALAASWNARLNGPVYALAVVGSDLRLGGYFTQVAGQPCGNTAAVDTASAAVRPWQSFANEAVTSMVPVAGRLAIGGDFTWIGGEARTGFALVDPATGVSLPAAPDPGVTVNRVVTDGSAVYVASPRLRPGGGSGPSLSCVVADWSTTPAVSAYGPAGSDTLIVGTTRTFRWRAVAADPGVATVDLLLSRSGPGGPWETLATGLANTGQYDWTVTGPEAGAACWFRVDAHGPGGGTGTGVGDAAFSVYHLETPTLITLFRAVWTVEGVVVEWRTADARAARDAEVDRAAASNGPWTRVTAARESRGETWSLRDPDAPEGTSWYRLRVPIAGGGVATSLPVPVVVGAPPAAFALSAVSPNPTEGVSTLTYAVPHRAHVRIALYDVLGREVVRLADGVVDPGRYGAVLDARDVAAGLYFVRMQAPGADLRRRLVITR